MAVKPERRVEYREVIYDAKCWKMLCSLRQKAMKTMDALESFHLKTITHGSIARGDVKKRSDIDVFMPYQVSSFMVQTALQKANLTVNRCLITQATPHYAMKAIIEIDENTTVSFPLMKLRKVEREFYKFGGEATLEDLKSNVRVAGVDKRLVLIEPTERGHLENTIVGSEEHVAKLLGISVKTVLDRVHALLRRDDVGRTGLFIEKELAENETFEMALKRLVEQNPAVRRRLRTIG